MLELSDYRRTLFYLSRSIHNRGAAGFWNFLKMFVALRIEPRSVRGGPLALQVEPTRICDLGCAYCVHHLLDDKRSLIQKDTFERILEAFPFAVKLTLQGIGEPLLHPDFGELVKLAKRRNLWVQTFTNGTRLFQKAEDLKDSKIDRINVSLDTVSQDKLTKLRRGAQVDVIMKGIEKIIDDSDIELHVYAVATAPALSSLEETIRTLAKVRVRYFHLQGCHAFGSTALVREQEDASFLAQAEEIAASVKLCKSLCSEYGMKFRGSADKPDAALNKRHCQWPWYKAYISCGGEVRFCCRNIQNKGTSSPGNLLVSNWGNIWNNSHYQSFRKDLKSDSVPAHCQGCSAYYLEY